MTSDPRPVDPFRPASGPDDHSASDRGVDPFPVQPVEVRRKGGGGGRLVNVLLGVALVVAVGGVTFAAGRATAPTTAAARTGFGGNGQGAPNASGAPGGGFGGGGAGGVSIQGTVTALSADSVTLQLPSGQSITVAIGAQTTYHQRQAATAADVTTGSTVIVQLQGGRGAFGQGGTGGQATGPNASGAPGQGTATTITVVPTGS